MTTNKWYKYQTIIYKAQGEDLPELRQFTGHLTNKNKFAFFDLDGTLITRLNGQSNIYHENDPSNWIFLGPVLELLKAYNEVGYQIVIISNQSNFNQNVKDKIDQISSQFAKYCNFEPIFICAIASVKKKVQSTNTEQTNTEQTINKQTDNFRKPNIGIIDWIKNLMQKQMPNNFSDQTFKQILDQSFMCGDAVGLNNTNELEYIWSDVDYMFAKNAGLKFIEPKLFFGSNFDMLINHTIADHDINFTTNIFNYNFYIMVGNQGSGKSTLAKLLSSNPCHFDELKTIKRMELKAQNNLEKNIPIVIDATNGTKEKRAFWINFAKKYNLTYCIVWIIRDGRPFNSMRTENKVPEIAYRIYSKYFEKPTSKECKVFKLY